MVVKISDVDKFIEYMFSDEREEYYLDDFSNDFKNLVEALKKYDSEIEKQSDMIFKLWQRDKNELKDLREQIRKANIG